MTYIGDLSTINVKNQRTATDYSFDASSGLVVINDPLCIRALLIVNLNANEVIYNPLAGIGGSDKECRILVDFDTTGQGDLDILIIVYEYEAADNDRDLLSKIVNLLQINNEYLQAILG